MSIKLDDGTRVRLDVHPDPYDPRDIIAEHVYKRKKRRALESDPNAKTTYAKRGLPAIYDLRPKLGPCKNQGSQGACAAMAMSAVKEYQENIQWDHLQELSAQYIHNFRVSKTGKGMMETVLKHGACTEELCPYLSTKKKEDITWDVRRDGRTRRISTYGQVTTRWGLKKALINDGVVWIAFPVYHPGLEMWKPLNPDDPIKGGHAMAVVGFDEEKEHFIIRNSWGPKWGDQGHTYYKYSDWGMHWSAWTCLDSD